jgi:hypothetical protein
MAVGGTFVLDVVEEAIGDLDDGLVGNVLIGLDAELQALETLWKRVIDLLLGDRHDSLRVRAALPMRGMCDAMRCDAMRCDSVAPGT